MEAEWLRGDGPLWQMYVLHEDTSPEVLSAFKRKLQTLMQSRNFPDVASLVFYHLEIINPKV